MIIKTVLRVLRSFAFAALLCALSALYVQSAYADDMHAQARKAERYLQSLETAQARFVQTNDDGSQLVGTFYLDRPGKLRFEYDEPIEDFIVADGTFIYFYDSELGEQTNALIGQTMADFILREDLRFDDTVRVNAVRDTGGLILVELVQSDDPLAGSITLGFSKDPYALKKWRVTDGAGLITEVELFYLKENIVHPDGLFVYANPKPRTINQYNE